MSQLKAREWDVWVDCLEVQEREGPWACRKGRRMRGRRRVLQQRVLVVAGVRAIRGSVSWVGVGAVGKGGKRRRLRLPSSSREKVRVRVRVRTVVAVAIAAVVLVVATRNA